MKIKLNKRKWPESCTSTVQAIRSMEPFAINRNGILIHRVRFADKHLRDGKVTHFSVVYWCGNSTTEPELYETPPKDRLLCARCESLAVANGQKSAATLAGRHVHTGRLVPQRVCCNRENN